MISHRRAIAAGLALLICSPAHAVAQVDTVSALERLAEQRNPKALYHLGMMYLTGSSVPQDRERAVEYFRDAAALGEPLAAYKIGCFYDGQYGLLEPDAERALRYKLVAAEAGYALAQQDVAGLYYRQGDIEKAMHWLEKAAAQGTVGALSAYASVHNGAEGVPKDPVRTAAYFRLFMERARASDEQKHWLADFEAELTEADRRQVAKIVKDYRPAPSQLTLEAMSGERAAAELVRGQRATD